VTEAAAAGELTSLVADLEASLGDSFPQAPATQLPEAKLGNGALPGWPTGVATGPAAQARGRWKQRLGGTANLEFRRLPWLRL